MAKNKSVRHHFIPQFYLQGFIDSHNDPFLWVYRKDNEDIIKSSVKDTAVHRHYYSFTTKSGERDSQTFEKFFSDIEAHTSTILRKIIKKQDLDNGERSQFATFLALTLTRVPNYRENMIEKPTAALMKRMNIMMASHKKHFEAHIKNFEARTGNKLTTSVEELRQYILKGDYDVKVGNPDYSLDFMFSGAKNVAPIFHDMKWAFFETTDENYFLTSDNPLYFIDPTVKRGDFYGTGLLNQKVEITFPISKNLMFLATWEGPTGYLTATRKIRDIFNRRTIISAQNFVFAPENSTGLGKLIQKYKGSHPRMTVN